MDKIAVKRVGIFFHACETLFLRNKRTSNILVSFVFKFNKYNVLAIYKGKGKVVYGQEPPSGESTTTECGFNYQLLAVITEVAQWGAPSCSQP